MLFPKNNTFIESSKTNMILKSIEGSLEFHLNSLSRRFYISLIIMGIFLIGYATYSLLLYEFETTLWSTLLGFAFVGFGLYTFSRKTIPLVFDKNQNLFFPKDEQLAKKNNTSLDRINALEILSYPSEGKDKAQLNLILDDGQKVHVCSYEDEQYSQIQEDTQRISEYLNKPIRRTTFS